ncbi:MAG: hypothetical protein ACLQVN_13875 [Bryobacteraceae bacterium]
MPTSVLSLAFLLICAEVPLKAYADPGSGLLLWQIVAAVFLGGVYQARKALSWIRKRK